MESLINATSTVSGTTGEPLDMRQTVLPFTEETTSKGIACSQSVLSAPVAGVVGGVIGVTVTLVLGLVIAGLVVLTVILTNRNRAKKRAKNRPILRTPSTHYVRPHSVIARDTPSTNTSERLYATCVPKSKRKPLPLPGNHSSMNTYDELNDGEEPEADPFTESRSVEDEDETDENVSEKYTACVPRSKPLPPPQITTPTPGEAGIDPYVAMSAVPGQTVRIESSERMYSVPKSHQSHQLSSSTRSRPAGRGGTLIAENIAYKNVQLRSLDPIPEDVGYENIVSKQ